MRKQEFLNQLAAALAGMDREERYRTLSYYDELIDDRMEDGQDEEQAVAGLGDPGQVAKELLGEEEPAAPKVTGRKVWVIVLLVLGFPLWGSLLLAGVCLLLALFMSNAGGLWDNSKKYVEAGNEGGKGSEAHKAAVVGDTVGDPYKDTAGPSINTQITVVSLVSSLLSTLFVAFSLFG